MMVKKSKMKKKGSKDYRKNYLAGFAICNELEIDADSFFMRGNKAAGARLRKKMLYVIKFFKLARKDVSGLKNSMKK